MRAVKKNSTFPKGFGWIRDLPDVRDISITSEHTVELLGRDVGQNAALYSDVDLREFLPPVEDQGQNNAACAFACAGLVEYFQRRCFGDATRLSKRFLYHVARRLNGISGDDGVSLRTTLKAMLRAGIPPDHLAGDRHCLDGVSDFNDPLLFLFSDNYAELVYVRIDAPGVQPEDVLRIVRVLLGWGIPSVFGFGVPTSIMEDPRFDFLPTANGMIGGMAGMAVGYNDNHFRLGRGAILFRNSWGSSWGELGYGWLPYSYIEKGLACDFWMILKPTWSALLRDELSMKSAE